MTQEIYLALLDAPVELPESKVKKGPAKPAVKKMRWREIKEKLISLMAVADIQGIEQLVEEQPQIIKTTYWKENIAREAIAAGKLEVLKYFLNQGLKIKPYNHNDIVWRTAFGTDDIEMFRFLSEQKMVDWVKAITDQPYWAGDLSNCPQITKFLVEKYGIGLGVIGAIQTLDDQRTVRVMADLLQVGLEHPELMEFQDTIRQLQEITKGSTSKKHWQQMCEVLWLSLSNRDRPDLLQKLITEKLTPADPQKLVSSWYEAMRYGRTKLMHWLAQAPSIKQQILDSWPNDPAKQKTQYFYHTPREHSLDNIQDIARLGVDLAAKTSQGMIPWIMTGGELNKGVVMWIAKTQPELFECKNDQGVTLMESLGAEKKSFAEKALLKSALVSRHSPLRTKAVKSRI